MSFNLSSLQALRNTKLIATYASMDDRIRLLGYALKYFAKVKCFSCWAVGRELVLSHVYVSMTLYQLQIANVSTYISFLVAFLPVWWSTFCV